jgi:hypothetical protein
VLVVMGVALAFLGALPAGDQAGFAGAHKEE